LNFKLITVVVFPPCKINLGLSVLSKRPDGYHNLETCFYPVPWTDIAEIISADTFEFSYTGNVIPGTPAENLCVKAYHLLKKDFELGPVKIHLHKVIPSGAGLGGGSSDAAYTLRLLNEKFSLGLSQISLMQYASTLGSDCAFFIQDKAMVGTGRGEILNDTSLSLKNKFLVVIKPDIHVSTADAFSGITPKIPNLTIAEIIQYPLHQWKDVLTNDFEDTVFKKHPAIKRLKEKLYKLGAVYATMSGTGSAVAGIFDDTIDVSQHFQDTTIWSGSLE
jgi:4-diphosphocytidyl-2-C-methyl-D-erythritol kinase